MFGLIAACALLPLGPARPTLTFDRPEVQATLGVAYERALDNVLRINALPARAGQTRSGLLPEGAPFLRAGGDYQDPWTRDASVNSWNAVSLLAPELARNTLWAVCEKGPNGRVRVQNDNQWWDKAIWVVAAWNHYAITGDREFLAQSYDTSKALLDELTATRFDKEFGLYQGPSHLQDGIAGYPAPFDDPPGSSSFILDHPGSDKLMTLSVNCLYVGAMRSLAAMGGALGKGAEVKVWSRRAGALKRAINERLWAPSAGSYAYMLFGEGALRGQQAKVQEATGISLAVLFGVAEGKRANQVVKNARTTRYGIPLVDPEFSRYSAERPGRHSRIVWPMAQGYWATAAAKVGAIERFHQEVEALVGMVEASDWNFHEIYNPATGRPDGGWQCGRHWASCSNQTWSASAYLRMIHGGLFGMELKPDGIALSPTLPAPWGPVALRGLRYRNAVLDIRLAGSGRRVSRFAIDGKAAAGRLIPCGLVGAHTVEVALGR